MSENITVRVVSERDVPEDRVGEWVFSNVLPGDRVELIGSNGSVELVDGAESFGDVSDDDVEQAIDQVKP